MSDFLGKMRDLLKPWMKGTSPLEIRRAILDDVESRVIAVGGGKRLFPFNRLRVHLLTPEPRVRTELEAVVREGWNLKDEVAARLRERDCPVPPGLAVDVAFDEAASPNFAERRFWVEYAKAEAAPEPRRRGRGPPRPGDHGAQGYGHPARLRAGCRADLSRPSGRGGGCGRPGCGGATTSPSARRATSTTRSPASTPASPGTLPAAATGCAPSRYASGTRIYRTARPIDVSAHDRRGVRLQSGDEVHLGRAVVKVTFK